MAVPICFKNEESNINPDNIWGDDLFKRKEIAGNYSKIIKSIIQPYVLSINARYGSGKTFFLKRWSEQLKQDEEHVIFFNAWDCDYVEKPLLPFLYNFLEQLKQQKLVTYDFKEDLNNCKDIIVKSLKSFIDKSSGGIINIDELKKYKNADFIKTPQISTLEEYNQLQDTLCNFKKGLQEVIKKLEGKNLYIFIDELERCRPTFAIELLEAVKHLFNVKGLVFILGIDRNQLKHTISNVYGCGMDGEGYLRRFIDLELELPQANLSDYIYFLKDKFEIKNLQGGTYGNWVIGYSEFHRYFEIFMQLYSFQLREIEQIYYKFNVITKMLDENTIKITPLLALLMVLKAKDKELYNNFTLENLTNEKISTFLYKNIIDKLKNDTNETELEHLKMICLALQPVNYYELINNATSPEEKNFFTEIQSMQRYVRSYGTDRIKYLKNMISCISLNSEE